MDGLLALANEVGVSDLGSDGKRRVKLDIVIALKTHFRDLHQEEKTNYHDSICFQPEQQRLSRKRKATIVVAAVALPTVTIPKKSKRVQRKVPCPSLVVNTLYKDCGYFLCKDGILKCYCDNRSKAKMDKYQLKKHQENKKHIAWKEKRVEEQQRQVRME